MQGVRVSCLLRGEGPGVSDEDAANQTKPNNINNNKINNNSQAWIYHCSECALEQGPAPRGAPHPLQGEKKKKKKIKKKRKKKKKKKKKEKK